MTPKAVFVVETGVRAGERVEVGKTLVIGREGADFDLDDDEVSHQHARVRIVGDDVVLEDCESTNGTWINGARITAPTVLRSGDVVRVGKTAIAVELPTSRTNVSEPAQVGDSPDAPVHHEFAPLGGYERRGIATRDIRVEIATIAVVVGTAAALIVYFALR